MTLLIGQRGGLTITTSPTKKEVYVGGASCAPLSYAETHVNRIHHDCFLSLFCHIKDIKSPS